MPEEDFNANLSFGKLKSFVMAISSTFFDLTKKDKIRATKFIKQANMNNLTILSCKDPVINTKAD